MNRLPELTTDSSESITIATHLKLLLKKRLSIRHTNRQLPWLFVTDPEGSAPTAVRTVSGFTSPLGSTLSSDLEATIHREAVTDIWHLMSNYPGKIVEHSHLQEPAGVLVCEITPDGKQHFEAEFFSEFYAIPVVGMIVNDSYLQTAEKIIGRLGAHIALANQANTLKWVVVKTKQEEGGQTNAIRTLKAQFSTVNIKFEFQNKPEHDRYIELKHVDGRISRVLIGVGLDFIDANNYLRKTFLVFQKPH